MNAPQPMRARIQAPEDETHEGALADLRAAELLISSAVNTSGLQWGWLIRCDIARIHTQLRNVLQDLS